MAEVVGLAAGLIALASFAFESGKILKTTLDEYRNQSRNARDLNQELEALVGILQTLQDTVKQSDSGLASLELPLLRCGQACQEFTTIVKQCTSRSGKDKSSFRDWMMLRYHEKDISSFRNLIAAYKSTIAIALANINIRHVKMTQILLEEYKMMIERTTTDLQDVLQDSQTEASVEAGLVETPPASGQLTVAEERASLEQCLSICDNLLHDLETIEKENFNTTDLASRYGDTAITNNASEAQFITSTRLKDCRAGLALTSFELQTRLARLDDRLERFSKDLQDSNAPGQSRSERRKTQSEELDSIRSCLAICADATDEALKKRVNEFEDIQMADDGRQVIVATLGDLISAKRVTVGSRSLQVLGQMSDDSLQQSFKSNIPPTDLRQTSKEGANYVVTPRFVAKHGAGQTLDK